MARTKLHRRHRWLRYAVMAVAVAVIGLPAAIAVVGLMFGLVVAVIALAVSIAPWVGLGYAGYLLVRRGRRQKWAVSGQPRQQPQAPPIRAEAPKPIATAVDPAEKLPEQQRDQVWRIRRKAESLLQSADRFPAGSRNLYLVQRTVDEYLPSTLDTYLAMPAGAANWPVDAEGRTGLQVLQGQLDLLEAKLDETAHDLWQVNVRKLLANERFLEQHFGPGPASELTIPEARNRSA
jgi:hypothetical protein